MLNFLSLHLRVKIIYMCINFTFLLQLTLQGVNYVLKLPQHAQQTTLQQQKVQHKIARNGYEENSFVRELTFVEEEDLVYYCKRYKQYCRIVW